MDQTRFEVIIKKYQEGRLSEQERIQLDQWMDEIAENGESVSWDKTEITSLRSRILDELPIIQPLKSTKSRFKLWTAASVAASLLFFIGYFLIQDRLSSPVGKQTFVKAESILPADDQVTITLENGEVVTLANDKNELYLKKGEISYEDGSSLLDGKSAAYKSQKVVLHTPKGKQISIVLEDGTKVWLNASSKLTYPLTFADNERKVELEGEGYFEVAHQFTTDSDGVKTRKPFLVHSAEQKIEVLGTKFNVKAYSDEAAIKTNLRSGLVNVSSNSGASVLLKPNQQALLNKANQKVKVSQVDAEESIDWMNNIFTFHNADLKEIMNEIQRWYDINVVIDKWPTVRFYGEIKRTEPLSAVINMIESSSELRFKIIEVEDERRLILQ